MLFMKRLKLKFKLQPKVKVDEEVDEEVYGKGCKKGCKKEYYPANKLTKWKDRFIENICYYFRCFKKDKEADYLASRKLYGHYTDSSETDLLNDQFDLFDPFDQVLDREDINN